MTIAWTHFTPWASLTGGALIGAAAVLLLACNGRIAGISGIAGGLFRRGERGWRLAFLAGLTLSPLVWRLAADPPAVTVAADLPLLVVAGLLVGLGTRYGSGCTSGHGICGLARRSPRSLAATAAFMLAGFLTVYLLSHVLA